MAIRTSYLITKALKNFMWGSIMAAVSSQIATTTDAIVVSNLIGPDAISAINIVMPILTFFSCLMILFGIGSSILAAKAIGRRDSQAANEIFSNAIIAASVTGVFFAVIVYIWSSPIVYWLTQGNLAIYGYALSYLRVMCLVVPFMIIAGVIENFVKTDGNPRIVMKAVLAGSFLNLILDIVFVKFFNMGIAGSAWATGLNYLLALLICLLHFRNPYSSLKWAIDRKRIRMFVGQSVSQGLPMSLNTLLLGGSIYFINFIILRVSGNDGIYCWSVCLQLFMIMQMVLSGIGSSIYAIGGILMGEQDMLGFSILNRKCQLYTSISIGFITVIIILFPEFFGTLFGSGGEGAIDGLGMSLRLFSLLLLPYSIVALLRATYQILGHSGLSLFLSIFQLAIMVGSVWLFSLINAEMMWWGFPISAYALLLGLICYTYFQHLRHPDISFMTLIPHHLEADSLNISVKMDFNDVEKAQSSIQKFLEQEKVDKFTEYRVRLACEELMNNIVAHAVAKHPEKHYFDVHIRVSASDVNILLKDDGRPFNPILSEEDSKISENDSAAKLGLKIVNNIDGAINYKYMYDQNMVQLKFAKN
ncbi:MAG: ATP-binding protein [Muribaculaceae bacterium]|nr:ATP-binding protein [Muribaculaceae bacterium]